MLCGKLPVRINIGLMIFTSCWVVYMLRVNMSLNLLAMVPQAPTDSSNKEEPKPVINSIMFCTNKKIILMLALHLAVFAQMFVLQLFLTNVKRQRVVGEETFDWTGEEQAMILGSYFWSYPVTSLVGGVTAERWGPRYVILITAASAGVLTILSPAAARLHYGALVAIRILLGTAGGFTYPALHALVARWVPPTEKGKFMSFMMGGTLGTVVTWSVTGVLIENMSWVWAFYFPGIFALLWCGVWWYMVADSPAQHPRISDSEKQYIQDSLGDTISESKSLPPFKSIATSVPFLAMVVLHYGNLWGLYFIMTEGPKFVSIVLGFHLSSAGFISALPYLARLFGSIAFGTIGDCILAKNMMSTTKIRKSFCLFSHIIPGALMVCLVYHGSAALAVALITMSMGSNGAAALTNLQNHQDLAPNFAGTLYGIANAIGSTAGFVTPIVTAHFTKDGNEYAHWRPVFYVGASVYILTALFFIIFGSGETQKWNFIASAESGEKQKDHKTVTGAPLIIDR